MVRVDVPSGTVPLMGPVPCLWPRHPGPGFAWQPPCRCRSTGADRPDRAFAAAFPRPIQEWSLCPREQTGAGFTVRTRTPSALSAVPPAVGRMSADAGISAFNEGFREVLLVGCGFFRWLPRDEPERVETEPKFFFGRTNPSDRCRGDCGKYLKLFLLSASVYFQEFIA